MATDYGGTYGDPPWRGAQPPDPGPPARTGEPSSGPAHAAPAYGDPVHGDPVHADPPHSAAPYGDSAPGGSAHPAAPYGDPAQAGQPGYGPRAPGRRRPGPRRSRARLLAGVTALVLGLAGLAAALAGTATQLLPRQFTAQQRQQITSWEYGRRWRELPAGTIFPASARYVPPAALDDDPALTLSTRRIGIARQAACRAATDARAAAVLDRDGCASLLAATYADGTDSYVVTVGVAVMPTLAQASAAARSLAAASDASGIGPGVHAVPFGGTPAAAFTDQRRQLSGVMSAGTYVVLYTAGYADARPREPVASDSYGDAEMTAAADGTARAVLSQLTRPVRAPDCPGAPGC